MAKHYSIEARRWEVNNPNAAAFLLALIVGKTATNEEKVNG